MAISRFRWTLWLASALVSTSAVANTPVRIVSEGKADRIWRPVIPLVDPAYPPGAEDIGAVCVNIGYYLDDAGVPSEFALVKSWSKFGTETGKSVARLALFEKVAVANLAAARFAPARPARRRPIYTSATFVFMPTPGAERERLRMRCNVSNLPEFIVQARKSSDPSTWNTIRWNEEWFKAKTRAHGLNRE